MVLKNKVLRNKASTFSSQLSYLLEPHKLILSRIALVNLIFIPGTERSTHLDTDISKVKEREREDPKSSHRILSPRDKTSFMGM